MSESGQLQTQIVLFMLIQWDKGISQLYAVYKLVYRSRWEGTYSGNAGTVANGPGCATGVGCSCSEANANSSDYSDTYKQFLSDFFIAQVNSGL